MVTHFKTFTQDHVNVFKKYFDWPVKKIKNTQQLCKCNCKKFGHVSVNDLQIHKIYKLYI